MDLREYLLKIGFVPCKTIKLLHISKLCVQRDKNKDKLRKWNTKKHVIN